MLIIRRTLCLFHLQRGYVDVGERFTVNSIITPERLLTIAALSQSCSRPKTLANYYWSAAFRASMGLALAARLPGSTDAKKQKSSVTSTTSPTQTQGI